MFLLFFLYKYSFYRREKGVYQRLLIAVKLEFIKAGLQAKRCAWYLSYSVTASFGNLNNIQQAHLHESHFTLITKNR